MKIKIFCYFFIRKSKEKRKLPRNEKTTSTDQNKTLLAIALAEVGFVYRSSAEVGFVYRSSAEVGFVYRSNAEGGGTVELCNGVTVELFNCVTV